PLHPTSHHRHPPSSPTRRSSDLAGRRTKPTTAPSRADLLAQQELRQLPPHDARVPGGHQRDGRGAVEWLAVAHGEQHAGDEPLLDRKSTRLNSSHEWISYAVFCL